MTRIILLSLCFLTAIASAAQQLSSPDGNYIFSFSRHEGRLVYCVDYKSMRVVDHGELGVDVDNHLVESAMGIPVDSSTVWTENLCLTSTDRSHHDETWTPIYGERSTIRNHYNEMILHFIKGGQPDTLSDGYNKSKLYLMDIVVRAYDEGIAMRYHFPEATNGLFLHITGERTTFPLPPHTTCWHEAWAQGPYQRLPLNGWTEESERPLLLNLPNGLNVALLEAALCDFPRGKFRLMSAGTVGVSLFGSADVITPYSTPWRVVMVAPKAVDLINNKDIVLNLNQPSILTATDFICPGKAFRSTRLDRESIMRSIDFCSEFGIQYVELDAGWYGPEMQVSADATHVSVTRDFTMPDICAYAKSKGVGVWLYVNQRALYYQLEEILPLYKAWGVRGVKFGFVQVGSQQWTTWLHQAVLRCAQCGLMVDIHDEYRPTGMSRTLPNLLTQEGIRGNEEMPDATHNVTLPFTRFLCGPADYTLCYFNKRVRNTKGHQLAMAAVYYSPLQFMFWYDQPDAYQGDAELQFWRDIPTVYDESIALDGEPGEYIIQARRKGNEWFIGAMTNTQGRTVAISTHILEKGKYQATVYNDEPESTARNKVSVDHIIVKSGDHIRLRLQPSGGAAIHLKPLKP